MMIDAAQSGTAMPQKEAPIRSAEALKSGKADAEQLQKVSQDFESLFLSMLMRSMRKTVEKNDLLSGGRGEEVFEGLLDMHLSEVSSRRGSVLGIGDMIFKKYEKYLKTTEDTIGREGVIPAPSPHAIGSSGGSSVFRGFSPQSMKEHETWTA